MTAAARSAGGVDASPPLIRFDGRAMASPLSLILDPAVPAAAATRAWDAVRDEFEACEVAMSRFRETSELTALDRATAAGSIPRPVGKRLRQALVAADRAWRITGGRFDPRVLRALDSLGYRGAALGPDERDGSGPSTRPVIALGRGGCLRLSAPVDLGGIGKGLALRWAAVRATGLLPVGSTGLIEAGGDLVALGRRVADEAWPVAIEDPDDAGEELAVVALTAGALATSSVAVHRWTSPAGRPVHHLVDPATGTPGGDGLLAVTVAGPDPAWAEVWSKTLFLEGRRAIGPVARRLGLAAWWVAEDRSLEMTPAARLRTAWLAREAGTAPGAPTRQLV